VVKEDTAIAYIKWGESDWRRTATCILQPPVWDWFHFV